jgi:DNA-binding XRE family transcriptional regulator
VGLLLAAERGKGRVVHDRADMTSNPKAPPVYKRRRPRTLHHEPAAVTWARKKSGLTKRALAKEVGISEQLMNEIESGWRNATPANLMKIAEVLNCPVVFLERKQ